HQRRMASAAKGSSHRLSQGMRPGASSRQPPMSRQADTAGSSPEARTMYRLTATARVTPPLAMIHSGAHRATSPSSAMSRTEAKEPPSTASEYQWTIRSMAVMSMASSSAEVIVAEASIIRGLRDVSPRTGCGPARVSARRTRRARGLMNVAMPRRTPASQLRGDASAVDGIVVPVDEPMDGGQVDGEQQRRGDCGRSQQHPRAAGRESANWVRPGQSQREEDEEGEWVDERRDAQ